MALNSEALLNQVKTQMQNTGLYTAAYTHEPKSAPGIGQDITGAVWINKGPNPVQSSGLNSVSVRLEFMARVYSSALKEPADSIDSELLAIVDSLVTVLCLDLDFGSQARYLDLLGSDGEQFSVTWGYLTQDQKVFRVADFIIPVIINDAWTVST